MIEFLGQAFTCSVSSLITPHKHISNKLKFPVFYSNSFLHFCRQFIMSVKLNISKSTQGNTTNLDFLFMDS